MDAFVSSKLSDIYPVSRINIKAQLAINTFYIWYLKHVYEDDKGKRTDRTSARETIFNM